MVRRKSAKAGSGNPWMGLAWQGASLAMEAQQVIALRLARLAGGGAVARREATRMVTEKAAALVESQGRLMRATSPESGVKSVLSLYRRRVRANRRRLSKG